MFCKLLECNTACPTSYFDLANPFSIARARLWMCSNKLSIMLRFSKVSYLIISRHSCTSVHIVFSGGESIVHQSFNLHTY